MLVLLFLCYAMALAGAYRVAIRFAPTAPLHTFALTLLLWIINLIVPLTYLGLVNLLRLEGMVIGGGLFWGVQWWLAGRLRPLPAIPVADSATSVRQARYLRYIQVFFAACFATIVLVVITTAFRTGPIEDTDAAWQYVPAAINMMQAQTLFSYDHLLPYLPLAFEMLFMWELAFVQGLRYIPFFHLAIWIASLMYTVLLVQFLLRRHTRFTRIVATSGVLLLLLISRLSLTLVVSTGKNDILLLLCTMAAVYYLLRYWDQPDSRATLVLVGAIGGLMLGAKVTAAIWLGIFALFHLMFLVRHHLLKPHRLLRDLLAVGFPFVLLFLPWAVRLLLSPVSSFDSDAVSSDLTILRQWASPEFVSATLARLPELLLVLVGTLLVITFKNQPKENVFRAGIVLLATGLVIQAIDPAFSVSLSLFITLFIVSGVFFAGLRKRLNGILVVLLLMVIISMALLAFVPYSATVYRFPEPVNYTFQTIMYRFSPGSYFLFVTVVLVAIATLSAREQPEVATGRVVTAFKSFRWGYAVLPLILTLIFAYGQGMNQNRIADRYLNFRQRFVTPTMFFDWFNTNVHNSAIYAINVPSLVLYGSDFSNRVYHATAGHSGYFGDMAYRWRDVQRLIEIHQWTHIVVSFSYPEMQQAGLLPTPEVLAEIEEMRRHLAVVYEDEQITMFATPYANPDTVLQFEAR